MEEQRLVLFVCPHGAAKSRMAAAFFNETAQTGWRATSAGTEPQENVSTHAIRLLSGTAYEPLLDLDPPRSVDAVPDASMVVAIDCPAESLPGAVRWELTNREFDESMRDEIRRHVELLAQRLSGSDGE